MIKSNFKSYQVFAAISGASCVMLGAFAAHALKGELTTYQQNIWKTAVFYQFIHTLLLLFVTQIKELTPWVARLLVCGIGLFSGSLYVLALTDLKMLGILTPFGGLSFILAWLLLTWHYIKQPA